MYQLQDQLRSRGFVVTIGANQTNSPKGGDYKYYLWLAFNRIQLAQLATKLSNKVVEDFFVFLMPYVANQVL